MTTENPYIFLKNNIFLQFLIADRFLKTIKWKVTVPHSKKAL